MNRLMVLPRRLAVQNKSVFAAQARYLSGTDTFQKKGHAEEERYFREVNAEQKKKFADMVHKKELQSLLAILPENHGLSTNTLHDILVWKHEDVA
uniref:Uncharacterized protein n=1 Tax=Prorocentrum micans TaxID=2945 RepID=A0A7S2X4C4_PROMC|mmetsp:Transcript_12924/g.14729  ORF Transcript_12924/g.14729 Transcript_12924/m.14729 type:complete len:95 (+) Transcript_12924:190-474(+)|eukprot:CAMPEP_0204859292 /NCGR_PEP_ID=MMETSP1347-20130617/23608_1 /ASSEMBLY_ACC=CAM_ASM_000690 /TAXON_ID=215587 /ORGANISM="Aplanochytrium stocchinoi, Strain GSBS06" /LENGTH=94 /DNA_ID=CAMNT_0052007735 /DNA_START=512 /DNA_END=796 /DNA_ORIENTATION=+